MVSEKWTRPVRMLGKFTRLRLGKKIWLQDVLEIFRIDEAEDRNTRLDAGIGRSIEMVEEEVKSRIMATPELWSKR